jgi:hypothetical protein
VRPAGQPGGERHGFRVGDHDDGEECQRGVAQQRRRTGRLGVQAAEAVALGVVAAREGTCDAHRESDQQRNRAAGGSPRCRRVQEGDRRKQLESRQQPRRDCGRWAVEAEIAQRPAAARAVEQLGRSGDGEHRGE